MSRIGWGATILGDPFDLEDWLHTLKPPFDPWVERTNRGFVLRSKSFDALMDATDVRDKIKPIITLLNGTFSLGLETQPIQLGDIAEFLADGSERHHAFAEVQEGLRARDRAAEIAVGPDCIPKSYTEPKPSFVQRWTEIVKSDDNLRDAVMYYSYGDDWFDIFKCFECLILKYKNDTVFSDLGWASKSKIDSLRQTANNERHARLKNKPNRSIMPKNEAYSLLGSLLRRALQDEMDRRCSDV